ncbi:thiosulfate oxidation carrier protein SoxY [Paucibacter sp. APW11]|uniref:Thiosulfate oxidation carrier protein SoxY n=1 Tax=Roseateles aquae TaxID=3077235 RepID=A0ABU3PGK6_9BURK|nr:thiosulfate oxidation carrier protein SoxY [Paucibacter sp. APW11]MDT9001243.1 thiosulfate oxidation carrier protein SoxY [Paucibacter sp. APW11]
MRVHYRMGRLLQGFVGAVLLLACAVVTAQPALDAARAARTVPAALQALGISETEATKRVLIDVPDIVDQKSGAWLKIRSEVPGTDLVLVLAEREIPPLLHLDEFAPTQGDVAKLKLKLSKTSRLRVIVRASNKYFVVAKEVKVAREETVTR